MDVKALVAVYEKQEEAWLWRSQSLLLPYFICQATSCPWSSLGHTTEIDKKQKKKKNISQIHEKSSEGQKDISYTHAHAVIRLATSHTKG